MEDKFLPIGSVVLLKDATKKVMIIGFCAMTKDSPGKIFDYCGCMYPEGLMSSDQTCMFDHSQIAKIYYKGFESDEEKEFKNKLNNIVSNLPQDM